MNRSLPSLFVLLLALSACAATGGAASEAPSVPSTPDPSGSPPPRPTDGDGEEGSEGGIDHPTGSEAVLVVSSAGGMLPVQMQVTHVPLLVITGDGRVVMQGMQTLEFPGPALPALIQRQLTEDGVQQVLRALEQTNLFAGDLELRGMMGMVADATDTIFTVHAAGLESAVTVYAIGMLMDGMEPPPGMGTEELEAYRILSTLNDRLMTLDTWLPADAWATDAWVPYEPDAFRLYVRDVTDQPIEGGDLPGQVRDWPTDDDPAAFGEEIAEFGDGTRCGVVADEAGATWLAELTDANQNTLWTDDGERRFSIAVRPLLPHEAHVCPELDAG
jgi:hypothetical protein